MPCRHFGAASIAIILLAAFAHAAEPPTHPSSPRVARRDAFFGLHFDLHPNDGDKALGADVDDANIGALLDRVKPDYVQYDSKGHVGWLGWPSEVGPSVPGIVKDSLPIWRKATADRGIALLIHFSGVWDNQATKAHPEWAAINADGKPEPNATSVFSPYVDERMIPQLREACTKYHLDGAWVDGDCWAARLDYSPAALAAWKKETGLADAPRKAGEPHWLEWKEFHRRAFERYVTHWTDALHQACPWTQSTSNWMYTTFMPQPVVAKIDFISGDYDPNLSVDRARIETRYLSNTGMPWDLMAWGFTYQVSGMSKNIKTPLHLQQEASAVLMQGGGFQVYYNPTRRGHIPATIIDTLGQVADFCRARQAISHRSTSIPQVAVIMSTKQMRERSNSVGNIGGGTMDHLTGALHAMLELHYSADVLAEHQIAGRVKEYPLVVVPDNEILSEALRDEIVAHVRGGGRLLTFGASTAKHFKDILGVQFDGPARETAAELLSPTGLTNCQGVWQPVTLDGAKAIGRRYPDTDERKGDAVAATVMTVGSGRAAAIYGPADLRFFHAHHPRLRQFIGEVARAAWDAPTVTTDAPPCVELSLRRARDQRLTVHLFNRANVPAGNNYGVVDYIPPVGPIELRVRCESKPARVEWLPDGPAPEWSYADGVLSARVPRLHVHGVLAIAP